MRPLANAVRMSLAIAIFSVGALSGGAISPTLAQATPAPAVTVSPPLQREVTEWDQFTGQFAAVDYVEIRARVSGYLTEIHFQDGEIVKKGDLLFVIDPRPFEIARDSAEAHIAQAQARL